MSSSSERLFDLSGRVALVTGSGQVAFQRAGFSRVNYGLHKKKPDTKSGS